MTEPEAVSAASARRTPSPVPSIEDLRRPWSQGAIDPRLVLPTEDRKGPVRPVAPPLPLLRAECRNDPAPDETCPGSAPDDPHVPLLEALEPVIPAGIRRRLGPHAGGQRRWLHLMHAAMTECLQRLSIPGPAWREAMSTLGLHRTTAIGIILAAITEHHPDPASIEPGAIFFHLVREEAVQPGSVNRHLQLLRHEEEHDMPEDTCVASGPDPALPEVSDNSSEGQPS